MSARSRPEIVELGATVSPEQARALGIWDAVGGGGLDRRVWFCELSGEVPGRLPLVDRGVVLRLRETGARPAEVTVCLCPCRPSKLTSAWDTPRDTGSQCLDLVSDWRGEGRRLSASLTTRYPAGAVARVLAGKVSPEQLFTAAQKGFLADCADRPVPLGRLAVHGPVHTRWWPARVWCGIPLDVERWMVTAASGVRLDLVELSRRVERQGAEIAQLALESALRRRGVDPAEPGQGPGIGRVLELLTGTSQES
ncbi:hypothetical protein ACFV9W_31480 [Streptomyces sp. NPDC059897]|uniref:hypothetical protein n=1 Tax=Streptomyces sp. NPDC059897 TaxID=3346994 RepID=UPI003669F93F